MELLVETTGDVRCLYSDDIALDSLGPLSIRRASHVEPTEAGVWTADLSPVHGPQLGPFTTRAAALRAEQNWLLTHWLPRPV